MDNVQKIPVSGYMITFNNARTVEKALKSIAWVDELVVVDSFSTDKTVEIAKACGARVIQRPWPGFGAQFQFAADQCSHDWAISVDADEEITPELVTEIQRELALNAQRPPERQIQGYNIPRRTWFLDRWIMHGGWRPSSDSPIKLFNRRRGTYNLAGLHATPIIQGPTARLKNLCNHYPQESISTRMKKNDAYTTTHAEDEWRKGKRQSGLPLKMVLRPLARFVRDYFLMLGFLDGIPGLIVAVSNTHYVFLKYAKLWEKQKFGDDAQ